MQINIFTDGAFSSSTKVGGWSFVITYDNKFVAQESDYEYDTTNNRMELQGILQALRVLHIGGIAAANIHTDSAYIANCFDQCWYVTWRENGWKTSKHTPVANQDLWEEILELYEALPDVVIGKVAGHADNPFNNMADKLAVAARIRGAEERKRREQEEAEY
jgi:ribonuclease HI